MIESVLANYEVGIVRKCDDEDLWLVEAAISDLISYGAQQFRLFELIKRYIILYM